MSWSVSAVGKPAAVLKTLSDQIKRSKCNEPEETIKNSILGVLETALSAFPDGTAVSVSASGSQSKSSSVDEKAINNLKVEITPLYGFVE